VILSNYWRSSFAVCCFTVKTLVVKGRAPVDPECYTTNCMHVYAEGSDIYDVMLNQVCSPYLSSSRIVNFPDFLLFIIKLGIDVFHTSITFLWVMPVCEMRIFKLILLIIIIYEGRSVSSRTVNIFHVRSYNKTPT